MDAYKYTKPASYIGFLYLAFVILGGLYTILQSLSNFSPAIFLGELFGFALFAFAIYITSKSLYTNKNPDWIDYISSFLYYSTALVGIFFIIF